MITLIERKTANEAWKAAVEKFHDDEKNTRIQSSRAGNTRELLHTVFTVTDPRQRWVVSRSPAINPAFAIAEVVWIINGRQDSAFLLPWNRKLSQYSGDSENYHGAYGYRLRKNLGLDQIERAFQALSGNRDSRQVVMQIWDSRLDLPNPDGSPISEDIPCNLISLLKVRDNKLDWTQILRSNDLFRGVPYNFVQFTTLQEIMAGWLEVELGNYHHWSDSLHLYEKDFNLSASTQDVVNITEEQNLDSLMLPKTESVAVLKELEKSIELLASEDLSPEALEALIERENLPAAYQNLLFLMASESARRRGWSDLIEAPMWGCTNPLLIQAWLRWYSRFKSDEQSTGLDNQLDI